MSLRHERTESQMQKIIADIIRNDIKERDLLLITITKLELSKDLSNAKIFFTNLGGKEKQISDLNTLNKSKGFIKKQLAKRIKIRKVPNLIFTYDNSIDIRNDFEKLLKSIKKTP
ncbi:MAG: 30S ribosome-binding factor RbfA [Bacilli bacterium]